MHQLEGKKIAVLTENGFEETELTSPMQALRHAGATVHIVSPQADRVRAKSGDEWSEYYNTDVALSKASADDYDALLIPGGVVNPDKLRTNEEAIAFVKHFFETSKPVAAICHGPQVLINADVVKNRKLTSVNAIKTDLINAGSEWTDAEVVEDRGLVTSRTPKDLPAFNKKIIEVFSAS